MNNKKELLANKSQVEAMIVDSSKAIREKAQQTLREVKELVGLRNIYN